MRPLVQVTWDGGVRFTADVRGHKVQVDQPRQGGGEDNAGGDIRREDRHGGCAPLPTA